MDYHQKLANAEAAEAGSPGLATVDDDADLDDSYVEGLNCNLYDDDNEYPSPQCIKGDALTCSTAVAGSYYYNLTCYGACHEDGGGWGVPCGWEAMKNMPDVCDDRTTGPNVRWGLHLIESPRRAALHRATTRQKTPKT